MNSLLVSVLLFAGVYGGALLGFALRGRIPEDYLSSDSRDVVKLATGLIGTMAALVLGLLVASAKSSYDKQKDELTEICADVALLDRGLSHYGPDAADARRTLRETVQSALDQIWSRTSVAPPASGEAIYREIERLPATSEEQRSIKTVALQITLNLGRTRWLMHAQSGRSVLTPLLVIVAFWLAAIFVGFGLYARPNPVVHAALFTCAISVASAIYLILEMDRPFQGLIRISDAPLRDVMSRIGN
jgi:hypothetical protein